MEWTWNDEGRRSLHVKAHFPYKNIPTRAADGVRTGAWNWAIQKEVEVGAPFQKRYCGYC